MNKWRLIFLCNFFIPLLSFGQDKDLDYYISNAVSNSPLLNDFRNQVLLNKADSQLLLATTRVQVTGNGNSFYAPVIAGYGYDKILTNGGQLQALVTASKNLFPKNFLNLQFFDLQLTGDSIRTASRISELDLKKNIINQYITVYGDQLQLGFNNELHALLSREEIILKRLTQKNVYKQVDYLSFLVTYQQQNLTQQQLAVQYKNDFSTLNYLAGIFDTSTTILPEPSMSAIRDFATDTSAFFQKFRIDSLRLINNRSLINFSYKPHINLFADGGYQSSLQVQPYKNLGTSFGINFTVPIYNGHQKKLQFLKIDIAERTRLRNREFFERQYYQQVAQLQQQLSAIENLLDPINKQIKYIQTLIDVNGKLLETGDIKMTDYILALNNYITAKNLVVQNTIARYLVINQLNYWKK
ncbi:MAG: TolC family protein [Chitinophagaceae bacterium]|nr:TolC family protein [Chitinophagaceae bacterium]